MCKKYHYTYTIQSVGSALGVKVMSIKKLMLLIVCSVEFNNGIYIMLIQ